MYMKKEMWSTNSSSVTSVLNPNNPIISPNVNGIRIWPYNVITQITLSSNTFIHANIPHYHVN